MRWFKRRRRNERERLAEALEAQAKQSIATAGSRLDRLTLLLRGDGMHFEEALSPEVNSQEDPPEGELHWERIRELRKKRP